MFVRTTIESSKQKEQPGTLFEEKVIKKERSVIESIGPIMEKSFRKLSFVQIWILNFFSVYELFLSNFCKLKLEWRLVSDNCFSDFLEEFWVLYMIILHFLQCLLFILSELYDFDQAFVVRKCIRILSG